MEIKATIVETLAGKYTTTEIEKHVDHFMNDNSDISTDILNIGIVIIYNMGWQKRSTGRIYDSLSSHRFMIGCVTGNVVSVGVRENNATDACVQIAKM